MNGTALPPRKRLFLDVCCFQRPFDDPAQLRIRLESEAVLAVIAHCRAGGCDLLSSESLEYEVGLNPHPDRRLHTEAVLAEAAEVVATSEGVERRAAELVAAGLRPFDALHLASAAAGRADYFCTCDDQLLRRGRVVQTFPPRVLSPLELVTELNL